MKADCPKYSNHRAVHTGELLNSILKIIKQSQFLETKPTFIFLVCCGTSLVATRIWAWHWRVRIEGGEKITEELWLKPRQTMSRWESKEMENSRVVIVKHESLLSHFCRLQSIVVVVKYFL